MFPESVVEQSARRGSLLGEWLRTCRLIAVGLLIAGVGGCAQQPKEVIAGKLGTVIVDDPDQGAMSAGRLRFLLTAALDGYSQAGSVPRDFLRPKDEVRQGLARLMRARSGVLWIGHSTFLIRIGGRTFLTDPMFSDFASPLPPFGPRRYLPPALAIAELPVIDAILISHDHFDHLDEPSLASLARRFPDAQMLLPVGDESFGRNAGFRQVREYSPGQSVVLASVRLTALPAISDSGRMGFDSGQTQAMSWSMRGGGLSLFFAGDTAYGPLFKRIRANYGPHDVALVPIGGYEPRDYVKHHHVNPEEATRIAADLGARTAIAMHWGTFASSPEPVLDPPRRFLKTPSTRVRKRVLRFGDVMIFDGRARLSSPTR